MVNTRTSINRNAENETTAANGSSQITKFSTFFLSSEVSGLGETIYTESRRASGQLVFMPVGLEDECHYVYNALKVEVRTLLYSRGCKTVNAVECLGRAQVF